MGVGYVTREGVKDSLGVKASASMDAQVDEAIYAATLLVEGCLHRVFFPWTGTRYFPWPDTYQPGTSYRLWLGRDELVSVSAVTSGGVTIPPATDTYLEPVNSGPPYTALELRLDRPSTFVTGNTHQRNIAVTGVYAGAAIVERPGGLLAEALDDSETEVTVSDASQIGAGSLIRCESERMIITERGWADTGQDLAGALTAERADVSFTVASGAALHVRETVLVDSERMLITDIAGNVITVRRGVDGSALAIHLLGASVFAQRSLTVERGALGTTAAAHADTTAFVVHRFPGPVVALTRAEAMNLLLGDSSGWARTIGSGESEREYGARGLKQLRDAAKVSHGRRARFV